MSCQIVFDDPIHANGGMIFADPTRITVLPPHLPYPPSEGGGRGTSRGIKRKGYNEGQVNALEETRRQRILREDDDIVALIASMLENGLM